MVPHALIEESSIASMTVQLVREGTPLAAQYRLFPASTQARQFQ